MLENGSFGTAVAALVRSGSLGADVYNERTAKEHPLHRTSAGVATPHLPHDTIETPPLPLLFLSNGALAKPSVFRRVA